MAMIGFDAAQFAGVAKIDSVPAGDYEVAIVESYYQETASGNGHYFKFVSEVLEGDYKGRRIFINLCVDHPNDRTVMMAKSDLGLICKAVGVPSPKDTSELHNRPFCLTLRNKRDSRTGEESSEVRSGSFRPVPEPPAYQKTDVPPWARTEG